MRQSENDMDVAGGQKLTAASLQPATFAGGPAIYGFCGICGSVAVLDSSSESSGLAAALRWRFDRCR